MANSGHSTTWEKQVVTAAARKYGISPKLLWGVYGAETDFGRDLSTSSAGAVGPFQFMPSNFTGKFDPNNFSVAANEAAKYLAAYKSRGTAGMLAAYNAGPAGNPNNSETRAYIPKVLQLGETLGSMSAPAQRAARAVASYRPAKTTIDKRAAVLDALMAAGSSSVTSGKLSLSGGLARDIVQRIQSGTYTTTTPAQTVKQRAASAAASSDGGQQPKGTADFEGTSVAAWIAPALHYARAHGWTGQVSSGFRSFADQTRIYNSGVRPAAKPGTSNHEGSDFPRGAVDVTDAAQLSMILQKSPYAKLLVWAGTKDPVHFSHPHNGSY